MAPHRRHHDHFPHSAPIVSDTEKVQNNFLDKPVNSAPARPIGFRKSAVVDSRASACRAGWRCQACGVRRRLDVHHVVKRSLGGSDFDPDLLVAAPPTRAQADHRTAFEQRPS
jgi:hypothetical protein